MTAMWQRCPVCDGSGTDPHPPKVDSSATPRQCRLCRGALIIGIYDGKPPGRVTVTYSSPFTEDDAKWCDRIAIAFQRNDAMDWDEVEEVFQSLAKKIRSTLGPTDV